MKRRLVRLVARIVLVCVIAIATYAFVRNLSPQFVSMFPNVIVAVNETEALIARIGTRDGDAGILKIESIKDNHVLETPTLYAYGYIMGFSPDADLIALETSNKNIRVVNTLAGHEISRPQLAHDSRVSFVEFSSDGQQLLVLQGYDAYIFDTYTGENIAAFLDNTDNRALYAAFNPSGTYVAIALTTEMFGSELCLWNWSENVVENCWNDLHGIFDIAWFLDEQNVILGGLDSAFVFNIPEGRVTRQIDVEAGRSWRIDASKITTIELSRDERHVFLGGWNNPIQIWDTATWNIISEFGDCGHAPCHFLDMTYLDDENLLLVSRTDRSNGATELWSIPSF